MFSSLILAAAMVAAAPSDGTYSFASTMNGLEIGRTSIVVKHTNDGIVLTEKGAGSMNGESGSIDDTLTLNNALAPVSYQADASIADSRHMRSTISFDGATAKQTGDVTHTYPLIGNAKHFAIMDVGPFSGFFMIPAQLQAWGGEPVTAIVPNFAHSVALSAYTALKPDRPAGVPANDISVSFSSMVAITLWYNPHTLVIDRVDIPAQGLIVRRV